jgi:hypothetical protein
LPPKDLFGHHSRNGPHWLLWTHGFQEFMIPWSWAQATNCISTSHLSYQMQIEEPLCILDLQQHSLSFGQ